MGAGEDAGEAFGFFHAGAGGELGDGFPCDLGSGVDHVGLGRGLGALGKEGERAEGAEGEGEAEGEGTGSGGQHEGGNYSRGGWGGN